jgi:hypothetical protein
MNLVLTCDRLLISPWGPADIDLAVEMFTDQSSKTKLKIATTLVVTPKSVM